MKVSDLNKAMQYIDDCYLDIADSPEKEIITMHKKKRSSLILIAAIVALMVLLMGCAWIVLHMEDFQLGQRQYSLDGTTYSNLAMTVGGRKGSAGYEAAREWFDFMQKFDPDNEKQNAYYAQSDPPQFDEAYSAYQPYAQEMVDELDRICQKYQLKLLGPWRRTQDMDSLLQSLALSSFLVPESNAEIQFLNGSDDGNGNFGFVFELNITGGEEVLPDYLYGHYQYSKKDFLNTSQWIVPDGSDVTEWNYTTKGGSEVLIVQDTPYEGWFVCNTDDAVIVFSICSLKKLDEEGSTPISPGQMERIADIFDFAIQPGR